MNLPKHLLTALCAFLLAIRAADAAVYQVTLTGTISSKFNTTTFWNSSFDVGTAFHVSYLFDTGTPDALPADPVAGQYVLTGTPSAIRFDFGDYQFSTNENHITAENDNTGIDSLTTVNLQGFSQNGLQLYAQGLYISLRTSNTAFLSSDSPGIGSFSASEFDHQRLVSLQGFYAEGTAVVQGEVLNYLITAIPEPGSLMFAAFGCVIAVSVRCRRHS